jgi:DNA primase
VSEQYARYNTQEIKAVVDIVEIISPYVLLKKRGNNSVGLCPFHKEKTPSFSVNESNGSI